MVETIKAFRRRMKLKKYKSIYFHNNTQFEFIDSRIDRAGRYADPSQLSELKKIESVCECLNNGKKYLLMTKKLPYTFDTSNIESKRDDAGILSTMAWDIWQGDTYDMAVRPTEKMDLIYIGLICLILGALIGTYFF